jgi:hypothetical protein
MNSSRPFLRQWRLLALVAMAVVVAVATLAAGGALAFQIESPKRIKSTVPPDRVLVRADGANVAALSGSTAVGAVVDGAAFRCAGGDFFHVTHCQGNAADAPCQLTEPHLPARNGLHLSKTTPRAQIAERVKACEAGGIRYGAGDKPVFVR